MSILEAIALTFAYYHPGQSLSDQVLKMYAFDLNDLLEPEVIAAYNTYRRNPKNTKFPLPAVIREMINPQDYISHEDQAAEIAARIVGAVPKFGWCNSKDAQTFIGPAGWAVVQTQGGWSYICENLGTKINPSTFQAQVRKQLEGNIKYGVGVVAESAGALPSRGGDLVPIGQAIKSLIASKNENEPEGAA